MQENDIITSIYTSFNNRQADAVLVYFHEEVQWPNGWEGGVLHGHKSIREYWHRQWNEINPVVIPEGIEMLEDGRLRVNVHQVVKDLEGAPIFDGFLDHIYTFRHGQVTKMEIG